MLVLTYSVIVLTCSIQVLTFSVIALTILLTHSTSRWLLKPAGQTRQKAALEAAAARPGSQSVQKVEDENGAYDPVFRGGLVFKAHRLLHHSTSGSRVVKKYDHPTRGCIPRVCEETGQMQGTCRVLRTGELPTPHQTSRPAKTDCFCFQIPSERDT
jgi:hypothetical protein